MKKAILASLLAAVVLFLWGYLFWGVLQPVSAVIDQVPDEDALGATLKEHLPSAGTYMMPMAMDDPDMDAWTRRHESGPLVTIMFQPDGKPAMDPKVFLLGFGQGWLSLLLLALLLRWISRSLGSFGQRFGFLLWIGVIDVVWSNLGRPIWFFQPWDYHLLQATYTLSAWVICGAILAWFVHGDT